MKKIFITGILIVTTVVQGKVLVPFQAANKLKSSVNVSVSRDDQTRLYTYSYAISNDAASEQRIDSFAIELDESTSIIEASAPVGWSHRRYVHKNLYSFSSTEGITSANVVQLPGGGTDINSPYDIKPGASLCCFAFKTFSAPTRGNVYVQGHVPTAQSTDGDEMEPDFTTLGIKSFSIEDNSFVVVADVPKVPVKDKNKRMVDGFVVPVNFNPDKNNSLHTPLKFSVTFAVNGEKVFRDTFKAKLNDVDITSQFIADVTNSASKSVTLSLGKDSPLQAGTNILVLSVEGIEPGSNNKHTVDTDRLVFNVLAR